MITYEEALIFLGNIFNIVENKPSSWSVAYTELQDYLTTNTFTSEAEQLIRDTITGLTDVNGPA